MGQKMNQAYLKVSYSDFAVWGAVTKYWIDPRLLTITDRDALPTDIVKNVIKLKIFVEGKSLPDELAKYRCKFCQFPFQWLC